MPVTRDRAFAVAGSTVLLLVALFAIALGVALRHSPLALRTTLTFIVWPLCGILAFVWSTTNVIRRRRLQDAMEALAAVALCWLFYVTVFLTPN
jgi:uncharacterized membrane protein (GlpM family)